ncbi:MAG TPA: alpha/beta hydrolase [Polyangium sp.]|nr:alpha/beta hydrolase [Polyangium sp.]
MISTQSLELEDVTLSCLVAGHGPVVLCAHGFPDDARTFRHQIGPLVSRGFRVVCPTMRGYAPSSVAYDARYDAEALGKDLCGLADRFSPNAPVRIIGHDWGAVAAYAATAMAPHRFSQVVTMAVPHLRSTATRLFLPDQMRRSWYIWMFQLRTIAEMRLAEDDLALIDRLWRDWSPSHVASKEDLDSIKRGIATRMPEVIGYYRAFFSKTSILGAPRRLLFAKTSVPALYIHGEEDGCVGVHLADGVEKHFTAGVSVQRISGAGHFVHLEKPDVVNSLVLDFFGSAT